VAAAETAREPAPQRSHGRHHRYGLPRAGKVAVRAEDAHTLYPHADAIRPNARRPAPRPAGGAYEGCPHTRDVRVLTDRPPRCSEPSHARRTAGTMAARSAPRPSMERPPRRSSPALPTAPPVIMRSALSVTDEVRRLAMPVRASISRPAVCMPTHSWSVRPSSCASWHATGRATTAACTPAPCRRRVSRRPRSHAPPTPTAFRPATATASVRTPLSVCLCLCACVCVCLCVFVYVGER
jgi:hypothetical protein